MLGFFEWLEKKHYLEDEMSSGFDANPIDKFKFNDSPGDFGQDHDKILTELIKMAMSKAPKETISFFKDLSRDDDEMRNLVSKLNGGAMNSMQPPQDEVMPAMADQGKGESEYES